MERTNELKAGLTDLSRQLVDGMQTGLACWPDDACSQKKLFQTYRSGNSHNLGDQ
jgi:hypothetical protein